MNAEEMSRYVSDTFTGVQAVENSGDTFFAYEPTGELPERWMPFATLVTGDRYDAVSGLDEPGRYRINIGLTKARYRSLFGATPPEDVDYAAADTLTPHPIYASQYWVSVVNPGDATLDTVRTLLAEAYQFAARKHTNKVARETSAS